VHYLTTGYEASRDARPGCSAGSRFITGQLIAVDGGLVMLGA
jgi:hypothetical protein